MLLPPWLHDGIPSFVAIELDFFKFASLKTTNK